jgi:uncharacterized protein (TIGR02217 family)
MAIPNYHDVSLDLELSLGAHVTVRYKTTVIRMREGDEERIGEWQDAIRTFDIAPALRHQADLDYLIAFFRSRLGQTFAFKMRDPTDYVADNELCGTADGLNVAFPLTKGYTPPQTFNQHVTVRPIVLPDYPLTITLNGVVLDYTQYSVDTVAGVVYLLNAPAAGVVVRWTGTFQVPVRFQTPQFSTSFAMFERFDAQILLQEERTPVDTRMIGEGMPPDMEAVVLPVTVSEHSETGPQYSAIINEGASGVDQRIGQFLNPRVQFQLDYMLQSAGAIDELLRFFHSRRGRLSGFLARDYTDYTAVQEVISISDGVLTTFFLLKKYITGGFQQTRFITFPELPLAVYVNGVIVNHVEVHATGSDLEIVNIPSPLQNPVRVTSDGLIIFAFAPAVGAVISWTGKFLVPVRFDTDQLTITVDAPGVMSCAQIPLVEIPTVNISTTIADIP